MKCDRENTVFGKKFDMFYYFVCTTQYITDTKQKTGENKGHSPNSTAHCNVLAFYSRHLKCCLQQQ